MNSIDKMAQLFRERTNIEVENITSGIVLSLNPLKITWGNSVILGEKHLKVSNLLSNGFEIEYEDHDGDLNTTRTLVIKNSLQIGDEVIMVPNNEHTAWYVIDKVG